jgi:predicted SAM-dependent methyltransferase
MTTGDPATIITLNRMGRATLDLTEYSREFVAFAPLAPGPVLDIGAGFGVATLAALTAGASVIANDVDDRHLRIIVEQASAAGVRERLEILPGWFPSDLDIRRERLGAIHASQVLHFLSERELMTGAALMFRWLQPGGRVFTISGTPYVKTLERFIPVYEERKRTGVPWPGAIQNVHEYSSHPTINELPDFMHFLDDETVARPFAEAGFVIERVEMYNRKGLPEYLKYDGRENVGLIARKP